MEKKIIALLLGLVLTSQAGYPVFAEETSSENSATTQAETQAQDSGIMFRDIPWYTTREDMEKIFAENEIAESDNFTEDNNAYRLSVINFENVYDSGDYVEGGGYSTRYHGMTVAGYTPSEVDVSYMYPVNNDGSLTKDNNLAQFYFARYVFDTNDYTGLQAVHDDLLGKLKTIYGDAPTLSEEKYWTTETWADENDNTIQLLISDDADYVCLAYIAGDADTRLDAVQTALDNEALAQEESERQANASNTDGL